MRPGTANSSCMVKTASGLPMVQPSAKCFGAGSSRSSPRGQPWSIQASSVDRSASDSLRALRNVPWRAPAGGGGGGGRPRAGRGAGRGGGGGGGGGRGGGRAGGGGGGGGPGRGGGGRRGGRAGGGGGRARGGTQAGERTASHRRRGK